MNVSEQGDVTIYALEDKYLQDVNPPNLLSVLRDHMAKGRKKFIFNFARIKDLFSPVVGILAVAARRAEEQDATIKLTNLNQFITKTVTASRLDRFFEICQTVNEALEKFKKG